MTTETAAKKDTQKLQRAIVDGLEDVKAQNIQVFNTEHLSPLFERVIVASGTSNRQTKALAASVRDAVREAGFAKPRIEGEENGEWIIVDCGSAVAHIMQPAIRQYYQLEDIWGEKPVRLKLGAPKPVVASPANGKAAAAKKTAPVKKAKAGGDDGSPSLRRSSAARTAARQAEQAEAELKKKKAAAAKPKPRRAPAAKSAAPAAKKPAARKAAPAKTSAPARKTRSSAARKPA